jgi:hypothetical protein
LHVLSRALVVGAGEDGSFDILVMPQVALDGLPQKLRAGDTLLPVMKRSGSGPRSL